MAVASQNQAPKRHKVSCTDRSDFVAVSQTDSLEKYFASHESAATIQNPLQQRFSNFFQVGTTFISQNVLRTTLLLSPLKVKFIIF
jgi:hypothetical protein